MKNNYLRRFGLFHGGFSHRFLTLMTSVAYKMKNVCFDWKFSLMYHSVHAYHLNWLRQRIHIWQRESDLSVWNVFNIRFRRHLSAYACLYDKETAIICMISPLLFQGFHQWPLTDRGNTFVDPFFRKLCHNSITFCSYFR